VADIAKLDAALAYIEAHPEEWRQDSYGHQSPECGTAGCLAFHVGRLDGAEVLFERPWADGFAPVATIGGADPETYARESLNVTHAQAAELFAANNSLAALKAMRDALAANPDISGAELDAIAYEHNPRRTY
jgi:hypothetical protein